MKINIGIVLVISFKFSVFELKIEHRILKELGEFTVFCMKAINSGLSMGDISNIIQIDEQVIQKQLSFALSREYMFEDFSLTSKGRQTVELFEFVNLFNKQKKEICLEHYVEGDSKKIYGADNSKLADRNDGYIVADNFYDYKVKNKFDEIVEKDKEHIFEILQDGFDKYLHIIENYIEGFSFKILKVDRKKFYNFEIDDKEFLKLLKDEKSEEFITVSVPILDIQKQIKSDVFEDEELKKIQNFFDKHRYIDMFAGESISFSQREKRGSNLVLDSKISQRDIFQTDTVEILSSVLLFSEISLKVERYNINKYLNILKIMENI